MKLFFAASALGVVAVASVTKAESIQARSDFCDPPTPIVFNVDPGFYLNDACQAFTPKCRNMKAESHRKGYDFCAPITETHQVQVICIITGTDNVRYSQAKRLVANEIPFMHPADGKVEHGAIRIC